MGHQLDSDAERIAGAGPSLEAELFVRRPTDDACLRIAGPRQLKVTGLSAEPPRGVAGEAALC